MSITRVERQINAPVETVFDVISKAENYSTAVTHITHIEFLSEQKSGVGTRFKETRLIKGREATSTLEVTELVENERIQIFSDEGGTQWISDFTTAATPEGCRLTLQMEAKPYKFMAKIFNPLFKGMIARAIADDMDAVKSYCENK